MTVQPSWFKMSVMDGEASIDIYDVISSDYGISPTMFKQQLAALGDVQNITLRINSPGGDVTDGFTIYNLLAEHPANKTVIIDGLAASVASIIAMAGNTVKMQEASFLMIHEPYYFTMGTAGQLRNDANTLDKMKEMAITIYGKKSNLSRERISVLMSGENGADSTWMTPVEAIEYGFADEQITIPKAQNRIVYRGKLSIPDDVLAVLEGKRQPILRMCAPKIPEQPKIKSVKIVDETGATNNKPLQKETVMRTCPACKKDVAAENAAYCNLCGASMTVHPDTAAAHAREVAEAKAEATKTAARAEAARQSEIRAKCSTFKLDSVFMDSLLTNVDCSIEMATKQILDKVAATMPTVVNPAAVDLGRDEAEKQHNHTVLALCQQGGMKLSAEETKDLPKHERPIGLQGLLKLCLNRAGADARELFNLDGNACADIAFGGHPKMQSSSEFPAILADVQNKFLLKGYDEAPVTFNQWCSEIEVKDFKTAHLIKTSNFSDIKDILEGADFEFGRFSDKEETLALTTKGIAFKLTRKAMINDDLGAFTRAAGIIAGSMRRRQNQDAYDLLTTASLVGPTMTEDSVALFNAASHYNLNATSGLATHTLIGTNNKLLRNMPLPKPDNKSKTQFSNHVAKYLISGTQNERLVRLLLGAAYDLSVTNSAVSQAPNLYSGIIPVFDPYLQSILDANSKGNAFYMATDPALLGHLTIGYLAGQRVPMLRSQPSFVSMSLGYIWDMYMEWGMGFEDWRGIVYNDGAV